MRHIFINSYQRVKNMDESKTSQRKTRERTITEKIREDKPYEKNRMSEKILQEAEKIADEARNSLGKYCIEECHAYCCRTGYLVLTEEELKKVLQGKDYKSETKKLKQGKYSLYIGGKDKPCPSLNREFKCECYKDRPQGCREFPLFFKGNEIILSNRCPAVREGKLYPYLARLHALGYKINRPSDDILETIYTSNIEF